MACPELYPAAALPFTFAAGKPLKWGRRSGPVTHLVVTTAERGTIWPWLDRVYRRVRSSGRWRYFGSDCRTTHQTRLNSLYWLTVTDPNWAWIAL